MSDALRSYGGNKGGLTFGSSKRRRGAALPLISLVVVALLAAGAFWISRDTHDIAEFLPARRPLQVRVQEAVAARQTLGASPVWSVLPDASTRDLRETTQEPLPIPEWLAKNLFNNELFWFGDPQAGEGVLVSRMTRVGTLAARAGLLMPAVEQDWAGGLNLSYLPEQDLYVAVRGRILIGSPSRRAVIEALTLADAERAVLGGYLAEAPENARIAGISVLSDEDAARFGMDRIEFGVVTEPDRFGVIARGELLDASSALATILANARPVTLSTPADAPAALVVNLGASLREVSIALGELAGTDWPDEAQWDEWSARTANESDGPAVGELLEGLGPELHLTLHDVDPYEVLPVPELVIRSRQVPESLAKLMQSYPPPTPGPSIKAVHASYNPESGVLRFPAPGGESLEPSAALQGGQFVFSTSLTRLRRVLKSPAPNGSLPGSNNAYLRIQPNRVIDTLATAGGVLAENALLEGHTPESFEQQVSDWRQQVGTIDSIEAVLRTSDEAVVIECEMRFTAP